MATRPIFCANPLFSHNVRSPAPAVANISGDWFLMGWMPLPTASKYARLAMSHGQSHGEGIHGQGYDHWDRLGKASLPSPCGGEGRPAGIAQEGFAGAVARLPG